jgi:hypothetical protein
MTLRVAVAALAAAFTCAGLQAQNPPQQGQGAASTTAKSLAASWGIFVYPTKNQTKEQQDKDEYECYQWAKQQTGIDPLAPAAAAAEGQSQASDESKGRDRSAVRGAARGAAAGAAVGEVADDDAGGGAKKGAIVGGLRARREKMAKAKAEQEAQAKAKQEAEAQAATANETKKSTFNKAFSACLEGRSYTVK